VERISATRPDQVTAEVKGDILLFFTDVIGSGYAKTRHGSHT
jgi:hypothetical protein